MYIKQKGEFDKYNTDAKTNANKLNLNYFYFHKYFCFKASENTRVI